MGYRQVEESKAPKISQQMEVFCLAYFKGGIAYKAAQEAYITKSERNASVIASRLLRHPGVVARLAELRKATEDAAIADVIERKKVLTEIVRGRIPQYITSDNRIKVDDKTLNSAAIVEITTREKKVGRGEDAVEVEITRLKLGDRVAAITEMNKMDKVYDAAPQVNIDNRTLNIIVRNQEAAALIDRVSERPQLNGD